MTRRRLVLPGAAVVVRLAPKDAAQIARLGKLQSDEARAALTDAQAAYDSQQYAAAGSTFGASPSSTFGQALGQDPIAAAMSGKAGAQLQDASAKYQTAANQAVKTYQQIVKLRPGDQQALFSLAQAADTLRQTPVAIGAYKRLLKFKLDAATAAQIRERIKTLQQSTSG